MSRPVLRAALGALSIGALIAGAVALDDGPASASPATDSESWLVAGNYDFGIGRTSDDCGCAYKTDEEKAMGAVSIARTNQLIGDDERKYLRTLPAHMNVEFQLNNDKLNLLLVHGSPRKINEYLFEDRDEGRRDRRARGQAKRGVRRGVLTGSLGRQEGHVDFSASVGSRARPRRTPARKPSGARPGASVWMVTWGGTKSGKTSSFAWSATYRP